MTYLKGAVKNIFLLLIPLTLMLQACGNSDKKESEIDLSSNTSAPDYAEGFQINKIQPGLTEIIISSPWTTAKEPVKYALVSSEVSREVKLNNPAYDAVITTPVKQLVVTSTTHIPALEALDALEVLVGFPGTNFISSPKARKNVDQGLIKDIGVNEALNSEMVLELNPDLIIGFSINQENKGYKVFERAGIPVLYNADWMEQHPLGKAEWIKIFGELLEKRAKADSIYNTIVSEYNRVRKLAQKASSSPTVLSGAMYRDQWYLPAGESWAAKFLEDANADYLWKETEGTGSLSLSFENVLAKGSRAEIWLGASQFTSYREMLALNEHYNQFRAFREKKVYTFSKTLGEKGGVLFYELAPNRPDLVLKDMIHILHPELLPQYEPVFYKPLD